VDRLAVLMKKRKEENDINDFMNNIEKENKEFKYFLYWNGYRIKGAIREFLKDLSNISWKAEWILLKYNNTIAKNIHEYIIEWNKTLKFITNKDQCG
jgi:hypothetical protein